MLQQHLQAPEVIKAALLWLSQSHLYDIPYLNIARLNRKFQAPDWIQTSGICCCWDSKAEQPDPILWISKGHAIPEKQKLRVLIPLDLGSRYHWYLKSQGMGDLRRLPHKVWGLLPWQPRGPMPAMHLRGARAHPAAGAL